MTQVDPKVLEDGKVLLALKDRFIAKPNQENFLAMLSCLIDTPYLRVPMTMEMDDPTDLEKFTNAKEGDTVTTNGAIHMKPDWMKQGEDLYFPIFSNVEEATPEYSRNFSWLNMPIGNCIEFVEHKEGAVGIVLDAFTRPVRLDMNILDGIKKTLANIKKDEEKAKKTKSDKKKK